MGGRQLKRISKNIIAPGINRKPLCPCCLDGRAEENRMVKDEASQCMMCNVCGYIAPHQLQPVTASELEAGNQVDVSTPYVSTASMTQKRTIKSTRDIYDNPMDAWQSEP